MRVIAVFVLAAIALAGCATVPQRRETGVSRAQLAWCAHEGRASTVTIGNVFQASAERSNLTESCLRATMMQNVESAFSRLQLPPPPGGARTVVDHGRLLGAARFCGSPEEEQDGWRRYALREGGEATFDAEARRGAEMMRGAAAGECAAIRAMVEVVDRRERAGDRPATLMQGGARPMPVAQMP